jgi:hypothetical protein
MIRLNREALFSVALCVLVVGARFLPHVANFSPALSLLMYVGFIGRQKSESGRRSLWLWVLGPAMLFASDLAIGIYDGMGFVYASYGLCLLAGAMMTQARLGSLLFAGLLNSVLFFALSNYGVWQSTHLYTHDDMGLLQCYVMALPFFHQTVISTLGGLLGMFSLRRLLRRMARRSSSVQRAA